MYCTRSVHGSGSRGYRPIVVIAGVARTGIGKFNDDCHQGRKWVIACICVNGVAMRDRIGNSSAKIWLWFAINLSAQLKSAQSIKIDRHFFVERSSCILAIASWNDNDSTVTHNQRFWIWSQHSMGSYHPRP